MHPIPGECPVCGGELIVTQLACRECDTVIQGRFITGPFANLTNDAQVAMMIDNRENKAADLHDAVAVAAMGTAEEVVGPEKEALLKVYISKHPHLEAFARAPSCALLKLSVERYDIARKFQNVMELRMMP